MRTPLAAIAATLILAAPAHGAATFLPAENYRAHTGPASLLASSYMVDTRGWGDVAVVNQASNDISFLAGTAFGGFAAPVNKPAPSGPVSVAFGPADVENDINLAIANRASNSFGMVGNLQDVVTGEQRLGAAGLQPSAVATNYFDVIVANEGSDTITYAAGDGEGGIGIGNFPAGDGPSGVATADANSDGLADVLVSNRNAGNVSVLMAGPNPDNTPNRPAPPLFAAPVFYPAGAQPSDLAVGQLDGTGRQDLVVPNEGSSTVSALLAQPTGGYAGQVAYRVGSRPTAVTLGDVDGDGRTDVVVANSGSNTVSVLAGNGNGTFDAARSFRAHTRPSDVAIVDVNQDGAKDLVVSNAGSNDVSVLLQSPAAIASCHKGGKAIVTCGLRVSGSSRRVRAAGRVTNSTGRIVYATSAMTINTTPNRTSTMRLVPRARFPEFVSITVTFSIPGARRQVVQTLVT